MRVGLCATCSFRRDVVTARGSRFVLCRRSAVDPAFPRYPALPVVRCRGYAPPGAPQAPGGSGSG